MGYNVFLSLHLFKQIESINQTTRSLKSLGLFYGYVRSSRQTSGLYPNIGMSEKYQVKCIYKVYMYYWMKIFGHLTYSSCTDGVLDT